MSCKIYIKCCFAGYVRWNIFLKISLYPRFGGITVDGYGNPNDPVESNSQPTGYVSNNTDCDDNDADEHPGQTWYKDADGDGYSESTTDLDSCERPANYFIASELVASSGDCNDDDENINPGAIEICDDTSDNDCDGYVDCFDTDCDCSPTYELLHERIGQFSWYDDNSNCACLPCVP